MAGSTPTGVDTDGSSSATEPGSAEGRPSKPRVTAKQAGAAGLGALTLGALGVVFGDIGTSPLYAMQTIFLTEGIKVDEDHVYGIISLVFWSITIIVSIKYVTVIMRADNEGEGGIMALIALVQSALSNRGGPVGRCWSRWASSARPCSTATA